MHKLYKIYNDHEIHLSEEHAVILQALEVTAGLFNYKIEKGWARTEGFIDNVRLEEVISFYVHAKHIKEHEFNGAEKYKLAIGLDRNKEVITAYLFHNFGRDRDFKQETLTKGLNDSIYRLLEEIVNQTV